MHHHAAVGGLRPRRRGGHLRRAQSAEHGGPPRHRRPSSPISSTAFDVWLRLGGAPRLARAEEQRPILLQVRLSPTHRLRALLLLGRFVSLGAWAVSEMRFGRNRRISSGCQHSASPELRPPPCRGQRSFADMSPRARRTCSATRCAPSSSTSSATPPPSQSSRSNRRRATGVVRRRRCPCRSCHRRTRRAQAAGERGFQGAHGAAALHPRPLRPRCRLPRPTGGPRRLPAARPAHRPRRAARGAPRPASAGRRDPGARTARRARDDDARVSRAAHPLVLPVRLPALQRRRRRAGRARADAACRRSSCVCCTRSAPSCAPPPSSTIASLCSSPRPQAATPGTAAAAAAQTDAASAEAAADPADAAWRIQLAGDAAAVTVADASVAVRAQLCRLLMTVAQRYPQRTSESCHQLLWLRSQSNAADRHSDAGGVASSVSNETLERYPVEAAPGGAAACDGRGRRDPAPSPPAHHVVTVAGPHLSPVALAVAPSAAARTAAAARHSPAAAPTTARSGRALCVRRWRRAAAAA